MTMTSKYASYPSLLDRVVVITGGATGIGGSLVEHFALQGSEVIFFDIQTDAAHLLIESLKQKSKTNTKILHIPQFIHCDVTDINNSLKPACEKILRSKTVVHAVINNAARDMRQETSSITVDDWDNSLNVNLRHHFFLTQFLTQALIDSGSGSIINMGSITWAVPATGLAPYVVSKAAIVGLTRTLAHELGSKGVRVNSILPGAIATERQKKEVLTDEYQEWVLSRQALKRLLQPGDVARMALWLVADDSEGVTNQGLVVDGGWV
ncbi:short chain dehydrogenase [Talaromyces proteolyticus]|uniref:Short chain dehydrogenase n=1 Tax=Talaromyces proteolyticus TaxID=1131652 RepID=A0AAD4PYA9_9EURO|nr:short chain dehydrogenase [Talaromyces proteolyticus]KAH8700970.1 short chain dehydrogenase [Talaromyces proteolyticus]